MLGISWRNLALALTTGVAMAASAPTHAEEGDLEFGRFVLDMMEAGQTADSIADKIRARSIEIRAGWGKEGAVTEEEWEWHKHRNRGDREAGPGQGPPPWAPAHGYRRKFGAQEQTDLGAYTHRRVREGSTGVELIVAIREAVDRVSRGEPVDPERGRESADDHRRDTEKDGREKPNADKRGDKSGESHGKPPATGKRDGKGRR